MTGCQAGAIIVCPTAILSYPHIPESSISVGGSGMHPPGVLSRVAGNVVLIYPHCIFFVIHVRFLLTSAFVIYYEADNHIVSGSKQINNKFTKAFCYPNKKTHRYCATESLGLIGVFYSCIYRYVSESIIAQKKRLLSRFYC